MKKYSTVPAALVLMISFVVIAYATNKSSMPTPAGGNWFWAKYDKNLTVLAEGKIAGCLDCHTDATTNDYVFSGKAK